MQGNLIGAEAQDKKSGKVWSNTIFTKDNLLILRGLESETIDLIATDPPFNSKQIFNAPIGSGSEGANFKDIWSFDDIDGLWIEETLRNEYPAIYHLVESILFMGDESLASFIIYMIQRVIEMHRILKPTGALYLHCDPTASHYIKIMLDSIFGKENFRNDIVWGYASPSASRKKFPRKHDNIFFYAKSDEHVINFDDIRIPYKSDRLYGSKGTIWKKPKDKEREKIALERGKIPASWWADIGSGGHMPKNERTGYPTQKPLALYERIIKASSNKDDIVLDPFCGCATTCIAAHKLQRGWIGIDVSEKAYDLVAERLEREIGLEASYISGLIHHRTDVPVRVRDIICTPKKELKKRLYGEQEGLCNHCQQNFPIELFDIDHIVPTSRGGHDGDDNKQLLCRNCNSTKGSKRDETAKAIMQKRMQELRGLPNKYRKSR